MTKPTLYTWGTPNGLKPILMLEELGVDYELVKVHIGKGEQKEASFHAKNLNERIPVLEDEIGGKRVALSESAAILIHLAETNGSRFFPTSGEPRARALEWTFFQMAAVGPMFGQVGFWKRKETKNAEAIERYEVESKRIYGVLDERLGAAKYLAGDEYSIADMCTIFWARAAERLGLSIDTWPNVKRWIGAIEERPAMQRTLALTWP
ncbi:MAG: glutathione binding-like protein [Polyangiaceae bacterium]